ncbi:MAG: HD domain-containing protein, partial [Candidatus Eremiobacteraeota bacterium]|nr:HD domain-containing protein [Candidatus Eremiobacteraeota bacterium]
RIERNLYFLRLIIFLLLLIVGYLLLTTKPSFAEKQDSLVYLAVASAIYLAIFYFMIGRTSSQVYHFVSILLDLILLSFLVVLTGLYASPFFIFYLFIVAEAGIEQPYIVSLGSALIVGLIAIIYAFLPETRTYTPASLISRLALIFSLGVLVGRPSDVIHFEASKKTMDTDKLLEEQYNRTRNLVREMEKQNKEMQEQKRKLEGLIQMSRVMSTTRDPQTLLEFITTQARDDMNSQISFLLLVFDDKLHLISSQGISEPSKKIFECRVGEGLFGSVAETGRPVRLSEKDAESDPRYHSLSGARERIRNILCVPLQTKMDRRPLGVLGIANLLVGDEYTPANEDFITLLATDAAIAYKNAILYDELEKSYLEIILALSQAVEAKDPYTSGHVDRVRWLSVRLARYLGFKDDQLELIAKAAILHDVGKISTPEHILLKPGRLTDEEREIMNDHASAGYRILKGISSLDPQVLDMVLHHHERYDGKGYPDGLEGEKISVGAQIIAVADTFDAMTSDRPYRRGFQPSEAIARLQDSVGTQFNPVVIKAFFELYDRELKYIWKKE